jgi:hypothetical protein
MLKGSLATFLGNVWTKAAVALKNTISAGIEWVKTGQQMAAQAEGVKTAFDKINTPDLLRNLRSSTKGLISDFDLMKAAVRAENFKIPVEQLGTLLKFAQQRAQETGQSVDYLAESIIMGLGRKSAPILDNLGISSAVLRAEVKKTGDFASGAINIINRELQKQGDLALTSADRAQQTEVLWQNAQLKIGQGAQWLADIWNGISQTFAKEIIMIADRFKSADEALKEHTKTVVNLKQNIEPLLSRYDDLSKKTILSVSEQEELKRIITEVSSAMPGAVTAIDEYGNAIAISTSRVREYINTEVARLNVINRDAIRENEKKLAKINAQLEDTKKIIDEINETGTFGFSQTNYVVTGGGVVVPDETTYVADQEAIAEKQALYRQLIEDQKGYQAEIDRLSGDYLLKQLEESRRMQEEYNKRLETEKEYRKKSREELKKLADQNDETAQKVYNELYSDSKDKEISKETAAHQKLINNTLEKLKTEHLEKMSGIKKQYLAGDIKTQHEYNLQELAEEDRYDEQRKTKLKELLKSTTDPSLKIDVLKQIADIDEKNLDRQIKNAEKLKKIILDADPMKAEQEAYENQLRELGLFGVEREKMTEEQLHALEILEKQHDDNISKITGESVKNKIAELKDQQAVEESILATKRANGLITEGAYQEELLNLRKKYILKTLAIKGLTPSQTSGLNARNADTDSDITQNKTTEREKALKDYNIEDPVQIHEKQLAILADLEARGVLTHDEALQAKKLLDDEYYDALLEKARATSEAVGQITANLSSAISGFQNAELQAVENKYAAEIAAAGDNQKKLKQIEQKKQKEQNDIRAKYADKQFIVTVAQVITETALSAMKSYQAMAGIPIVGPALGAIAAAAAIAVGAGQIAVAKQQQEAAKAGYSKGGFTGEGTRTEVAGIVHKGEFVGNADAVANPAVKRVFNMIDHAQRNNTVSALTERDFAGAFNYRQAQQQSLIAAPSTSSTPLTGANEDTLNRIAFWLEHNAQVSDGLLKRLEEPFIGEVSITGRHGIEENMRSYDRMKSNATRKKN